MKPKPLPPSRLAEFVKSLAVGDLVEVKWIDSGKAYLQVDRCESLSTVKTVGYFAAFRQDTLLLSSDYEITERKAYGSGSGVWGPAILRIRKIKPL